MCIVYPPSIRGLKNEHKQTFAHWGHTHVHVGRGGAIAVRSRGSNGNMLHAAECQNGHLQTLAHWGHSHVGGGGASYKGQGL